MFDFCTDLPLKLNSEFDKTDPIWHFNWSFTSIAVAIDGTYVSLTQKPSRAT